MELTSPAMVGALPPIRESSMADMALGNGRADGAEVIESAAKRAKHSFPKGKIRVLLLESVAPSAIQMLEDDGYQVEAFARALTEEELIEQIVEVHVLGVRSKTRVTKRVLAAAKKLLVVGCFCIGTDQVDLAEAERRAVAVFNAPFANTRSVAELVIGEIIALYRKLTLCSQSLHEGVWNKSANGCFEIRGKTLGIVGYGHIGSQVAILAEMIGMRVLYYDVVPKLPLGNSEPRAMLELLLAESDVVSLHVPRSEQTNKMIRAEHFEIMKQGAFLINNARGTVVDLDALATALRSGKLGGAAVDVFPVEPEKNGPGFESVLRGCPNTILTPHIGGSTQEAQSKIGEEVASAILRFVNQGSTTGSVNFPNLEMPSTKGSHRVLNVHANVPGVLRDINNIIASLDVNVRAQVLGTTADIGYLVIDVDKETSVETKHAIAALPHSLRTRLLY